MDEVAAPADYLFALTMVSVHLGTKEHENNNEMLHENWQLKPKALEATLKLSIRCNAPKILLTKISKIQQKAI